MIRRTANGPQVFLCGMFYIFDLFTIRLRVSMGTTTATTEVWMGGEEKKGPNDASDVVWARIGMCFTFYFLFFYYYEAHEGPQQPTTANDGQRRPMQVNEGPQQPRRPTQAHEDLWPGRQLRIRSTIDEKHLDGRRGKKQAQTTHLASFGP